MINRCHIPAIVKSAKFQPLSFYSDLIEVGMCRNHVWILKWVNLHCNWMNLISVLNFPKQWVADYRCVFRRLTNI